MQPCRTLTWLTALAALLALIAASTPSQALVIDPIYAASITTNPDATEIEGAIVSAIATVEGLYSNNVTLNYDFAYSNLGDNAILETTQDENPSPYPSYSAYTGALATDSAANPSNTVLATAIANLPKGNDSNGAGPIAANYGLTLMLSNYGLAAPTVPFTPTTTINSFNNNAFTRPVPSSQFDLIGGLEHEINEVLGGGGGGSVLNALAANGVVGTGPCNSSGPYGFDCGTFGPLDLYRYAGANPPSSSASITPSFTTSPTASSYFSIDGGTTKIAGFNQNSSLDMGDFAPAGTGPGELIQNAFNSPGQYENYTNASPETAMMEALGWNPTTPCKVECYNTFPLKPKKTATSFTLELAGNVTGEINTSETAIDSLVNPFAYVNQAFFQNAGTSSAIVTFNGTNTLITYSGTYPILPSYTYSYGSTPHFRFEGTAPGSGSPVVGRNGSTPLQLVGEYWDYSDGSLDPQPTLGITCQSGGSEYLVFFADVTVGGQTTGEWNECQGDGVTLTNPTGTDECPYPVSAGKLAASTRIG